MIRNYAGKELLKGDKSIFLFGIKRNGKYETSWMEEACEKLEEKGFKGIVYIPSGKDEDRDWEVEAMANASVLACWVQEDVQTDKWWAMPFDLGKIFETGKVIYGRPDDMDMSRHIDWLYDADYNAEPKNSLDDLVDQAIDVTKDVKGRVNLINKNVY